MTPEQFKIWFNGYREGFAKAPHVKRIGEEVDKMDTGPAEARNPVRLAPVRPVPSEDDKSA